jgi:hypothetical protein
MKATQFKNSWDRLKDALNEHWSRFTDDDFVRIAGHHPIFQTVINTRYGPMQDHVRRWADRWHARWSGWMRHTSNRPIACHAVIVAPIQR